MRLSALNFGPIELRPAKQNIEGDNAVVVLQDDQGKEWRLVISVDQLRSLVPILQDAIKELEGVPVFDPSGKYRKFPS